jgi:hypothetical protein
MARVPEMEFGSFIEKFPFGLTKTFLAQYFMQITF